MKPTDIKQMQLHIQEYIARASGARANGDEQIMLPMFVSNISDEIEPHLKSGILAELRQQGYEVSEWAALHDGADAGMHSVIVSFSPQAKANAEKAGYVFPAAQPDAPQEGNI